MSQLEKIQSKSNKPNMENPSYVPTCVFERAQARAERVHRRDFILKLVLIILLVASNCAWLYYTSSFNDITVTQENTDGYNNFVGNDGTITN